MTFLPRATAFATATLAACVCAGAGAADATTPATPATPADDPGLAPITVTATRTERRADDVPGTVTVVPAAAIEARGAHDIQKVFADDIDVTVRRQANRFGPSGGSARAGNEGINIRGLEGNQVLLLVDGVRAPAGFAFGPIGTGRGDFLDVDTARRIEVLRGPASTRYGSDGLAGAVSLSTPDPADLLAPGRRGGGFVRAGHASVDRSFGSVLGLAGRTGDWRALLLASRREGHETANQGHDRRLGERRTAPNPARQESTSGLVKIVRGVGPAHEVGLTLDLLRRRVATEVDSAIGSTTSHGVTTTIDRLDARDRIERERVSLEHRFDDAGAAGVQKATSRVYLQDARTAQETLTERQVAGRPAPQVRDYAYAQRLLGLSTQFESRFAGTLLGLPARTTLSYGADLGRTGVRGRFAGITPPQLFPDTRYTLGGAFVQAEIERAGLTLVPGLRWDRYVLSADPSGYSGRAVSLAGQAWSPRLGLVWRLAPAVAPYLNLARGFRAPAPDQVNNAFANPAHGYTSIGNPDLGPERATSVELGVRGRQAGLRYQLLGYDNRYSDFIAQQVVGGSGVPGVDPRVFQYVNLGKVRIRGLEARADARLAAGWGLDGGVAWSRGDSEAGGVRTPLDTVEPLRAVLGLRRTAGAWTLRATALHAAAKAPGRIASPAAFAPPSCTTLDLGLQWRAAPGLTLTANLDNALDRTCWRWADVRGLPADSPALDAYTAPGRQLQVALRHDF